MFILSEHVKNIISLIKIGKKKTLKTIKRHTRKEIKIRTKDSKDSLDKDLEEALYGIISINGLY